jgi:tetratricopeptide (TPR) repeat protein
VARIVAAFEGNPLAIELAAARAGVDTSPETPALGEALDDAVRRSWRLLSLNARRAFARLAVVAGPFDAPLARAVLGDVPFDTVTALLEHSLLRPHAEGLWTMPATLRPFALARLDEEGRLEEAQHALVAHHAEVGRSIDEHDPRWDLRRRELAATIESHLEAVRLATDLEVDPEAALACARAAATLLGYSGPYAHALRIVESALDSPPGPTDCSRLRSQLAILRARLLNLVGRNDDACAAAREAAIAAEATGDASLVARAHDVAALVFLRTHALDEARAHAVRGIEVAAHEDEVACTLYGRLGRIDLQCMQIESARA